MHPIIAVLALAAVASIATKVAPIATAQAGGQVIEADNGQSYRIVEIAHSVTGGAMASIQPIGAPGDLIPPMDLFFDCHGHMHVYSYAAQRAGPDEYVTPRSVAGKIQTLSCAGAKYEPVR